MEPTKIIKVLIVEDSAVVQTFLEQILSSDPEIQVIGTANNGIEALEFLNYKKPDVILMDIYMPKMDGFEATSRIMETVPVPIIIVSAGWHLKEVEKTFRALEAGAVAVLQKPMGAGHPDFADQVKKLIQTVKLMSEVKVVTRRALLRPGKTAVFPVNSKQIPAEIKCVAIGASTGGPQALRTILAKFSEDFSAPVLIVQHIAAGFIHGLVDWIGKATSLPVHIAAHGEPLLTGHVYFAPDGFHMGVESSVRIVLSKEKPENGMCPSVSYLFRSVAGVFGRNAAGVLLSGMGKDGAPELSLMKKRGAITIVQDKKSSVVHGMPGEAIKLNAATYVLPPDRIAVTLEELVKKNKSDMTKQFSY